MGSLNIFDLSEICRVTNTGHYYLFAVPILKFLEIYWALSHHRAFARMALILENQTISCRITNPTFRFPDYVKTLANKRYQHWATIVSGNALNGVLRSGRIDFEAWS